MCLRKLTAVALLIMSAYWAPLAQSVDFVNFESGQVRPLTLTPDGSRLLAVNTPDNRLEIFTVGADGLVLEASVPVGLEPVAVAARSNTEVWVVNHLSDSVSIVMLGATPRVTKTLLVGDEPRDIVFSANGRAFITTAHRGQQRDHSSIAAVAGAGGPQLSSASVGRADVWVFDANNPGGGLGGVPLKIIELFGDTPRALTLSPDGNTVYAAVFMSGNQTAVASEALVCDGFGNNTCNGDGTTSPNGLVSGRMPGGLPGPTTDVHGDPAPETSLVVQYDQASGEWRDDEARNWSNAIRFNLPDQDVFAIDAQTLLEVADYSHVGTILFNMIANPATGKVYVSNTDAQNLTRFEGPGITGGDTVQGNLHQARISILDGSSVTHRRLNKHINYSVLPAPAGVKTHSLATPVDMAITANGNVLYVAAFGSGKVGVFDTAALEADSFNPTADSANYISLSGGGPTGLALDETNNRLYVLTRFDNAIAIVDTQTGTEIGKLSLYNPEPADVIAGRPFLYDANLTSSNGEASCAACHVFGDFDALSWDLGDPDGEVITNPLEIKLQGLLALTGNPVSDQLHPMKGPMTTQTLRGMVNSGAMHWRGDRSVGVFGTDPTDSTLSFNNFNVAFPGLVGRDSVLSNAEMNTYTAFALTITLPPNPIRDLDNSLTTSQQAGHDFFTGSRRSDGLPFDITGNQDGFSCNGCHELDPSQGFFGTGRSASFENETQIFKVAHLRNMYQKVGMFGMPNISFFNGGDNIHKGDQVRGTGFLHDGSTDTMFRFFNATVFNSGFGDTVGFPSNQAQAQQARADMEQFMFAFDTDLAPITGQQVTLDSNSSSEVDARIDLLLARAAAPFVSKILGGSVTEVDVVASGYIDDAARGYVRLADGMFQSDDPNELPISAATLRALVNTPDESLTFTAVPPGSGQRIGVDRDSDGFYNGIDVCPTIGDANQADDDSDGRGNACDNCLAVSNPLQRDTNGDGFGNFCDGDINNDNNVNSLDLGLFKQRFFTTDPDADLNGDGIVNALDLGLFKQMFFLPPGP